MYTGCLFTIFKGYVINFTYKTPINIRRQRIISKVQGVKDLFIVSVIFIQLLHFVWYLVEIRNLLQFLSYLQKNA